MTPSAPADTTAAACSGLLIPKPTQTGTVVIFFNSPTRPLTEPESWSLLPVTPNTETA